jgi:hypothetical protein
LVRPDLEIELLGINEYGYGGDSLTNLVDLPWMKDDKVVTVTTNTGSSLETVQDSWGANFRDVVLVGPNNEYVMTYNLTTYDIRDAVNYDQLKQLLIDIAEGNYP